LEFEDMAKSASGEIRKLHDLIKDIQFAMFTTATKNGTLRSRPMATQNDKKFDGSLWFFTDEDSAKVNEIGNDRHVNVSYADPASNTYVSVSGTARLVKDKAKAKELWTPFLRAWFPDGLDDPKLALIKVDVTQAEYWDSPNSKMVQLYGYVKAMVTGKPPKGGENKKISLRGPKRVKRETAGRR
jgi:general stress protein 26